MKYHNKKRKLYGNVFDSKGESQRFLFLKDQEKKGNIKELRWEKKDLKYPLIVNGCQVATYTPDFHYIFQEKTILEDFKGMETAVFKLKAKLFTACYRGFSLIKSYSPTQPLMDYQSLCEDCRYKMDSTCPYKGMSKKTGQPKIVKNTATICKHFDFKKSLMK